MSAKKMTHRQIRGLKYFFLSLPFVALVVAFSYVPIFGWVYTFFDYRMGHRFLDPNTMKFIGFDNFRKFFLYREEVGQVLRNTLALSFIGLAVSPVPMFFAVLLNEIRSIKFKKLVQTTTTLPNFISWIIVYSLAFALFSMNGAWNSLLTRMGYETSNITILGNPDVAWRFQTLIGMWKGTGWSAIIYIAAIGSIDTELYDAVFIDGGNKFSAIRYITIPGLLPTYFTLLLLGIGNILRNGFEQYFMFFNPMVADKLKVLDYYIYKVGILTNDYPFSITMGVLRTFISVTILFFANWASKKIRGASLI